MRFRATRGFTMTEMMFAIMILSIVLLALVSVFDGARAEPPPAHQAGHQPQQQCRPRTVTDRGQCRRRQDHPARAALGQVLGHRR